MSDTQSTGRTDTTDPTTTERAKETLTHAAQSTRDGARRAAHGAADAIDTNPLAILAGGAVIGAAIGALLPRTAIEQEHLAPVGRKLTDAAAAAARAAREAGKDELSALAPDKDAAKAKAQSILQNVATAAKDSARSTTTA